MSNMELLQIKCENPDCQKRFKMAKPAKAGIYKITCPECRHEMRVRFSEPQKKNAETPNMSQPQTQKPQPSNILPSVAKTQVIHFSEDALKYPARLEQVRRFRKNIPYELKLGENTIGRADANLPSDISIEGDMGISRRSICIDVKFDESGYHFKLRVLKTKNPVIRNGSPLNEGDIVSLKYDDTLVLGGTTFKFVSKKNK